MCVCVCVQEAERLSTEDVLFITSRSFGTRVESTRMRIIEARTALADGPASKGMDLLLQLREEDPCILVLPGIELAGPAAVGYASRAPIEDEARKEACRALDAVAVAWEEMNATAKHAVAREKLLLSRGPAL